MTTPPPRTERSPRRRSAHCLLLLGLGLLLTGLSGCSASDQPHGSHGTSAAAAPTADASSAAARLDTTSPASLAVLVNKRHPLHPKEWAPQDLVQVGPVSMRREAATSAHEMIDAAAEQHVGLVPISGYRSYQTQATTYQGWASSEGAETADHASARAGFSEHQTGLAVDFGGSGACDLHPCFAQTEQAEWVAAHALDYGFILRFPRDRQGTTGYYFEPWHYRYVGRELARRYRDSGASTWEDFLRAGPAPDYAD